MVINFIFADSRPTANQKPSLVSHKTHDLVHQSKLEACKTVLQMHECKIIQVVAAAIELREIFKAVPLLALP